MTREDELDGLIGTLYEAALEPELWREAIEGLLRMVDAQIGHLYFLERNSGRVTSSIMLGPGHKREDIEQIDADYSGYYRTIDPRQAVAARAGVGEWILCHEHWDEAFVRRSEFFNDFLIPSGMRYLLGARVGDMDEHSVFIGMLRAVGHRPFGEDEVRRIKRIEHHLARAARLYFKSEGLRRKLDSGLAALDALDFAALIVDQIGAVHFANSATEGLLRRKGVALKVRGSRLSHAVPEINVRLETLLREAVVGGKGGGDASFAWQGEPGPASAGGTAVGTFAPGRALADAAGPSTGVRPDDPANAAGPLLAPPVRTESNGGAARGGAGSGAESRGVCGRCRRFNEYGAHPDSVHVREDTHPSPSRPGEAADIASGDPVGR